MLLSDKSRKIFAFLFIMCFLFSLFKVAPMSAQWISIIETEDEGYSETETDRWGQSTKLLGYNDIGIRFTNRYGVTATWKPTISEPMTLKVSIYKVPDNNTDKTAQISVRHSGKVKNIGNFDPTRGEAEWIEIGTFDFTGDGEEYVKLTRVSKNDSEYTRVNAVKFEQVSNG